MVSHGRYVVFQMAEVAIPRQMFQEILRLIAELRPQPHHPRQHEAFDCHAFKSNRDEECVQMPHESSQISSSTIVRAAPAAGSHPHLASWLPGTPQNRYYPRWSRSQPGNVGLNTSCITPLKAIPRFSAILSHEGVVCSATDIHDHPRRLCRSWSATF